MLGICTCSWYVSCIFESFVLQLHKNEEWRWVSDVGRWTLDTDFLSGQKQKETKKGTRLGSGMSNKWKE